MKLDKNKLYEKLILNNYANLYLDKSKKITLEIIDNTDFDSPYDAPETNEVFFTIKLDPKYKDITGVENFIELQNKIQHIGETIDRLDISIEAAYLAATNNKKWILDSWEELGDNEYEDPEGLFIYNTKTKQLETICDRDWYVINNKIELEDLEKFMEKHKSMIEDLILENLIEPLTTKLYIIENKVKIYNYWDWKEYSIDDLFKYKEYFKNWETSCSLQEWIEEQKEK